MIFALPYLVLLAAFGIMAALWYQFQDNELIQRRLLILSGGLFILFFGFRSFVFYDWVTYYPTFKILPTLQEFLANPFQKWTFEIGFTLFAAICKSLYNNYQFFIVICTSLNTILLFRFLRRYTNNVPFALIIFLCMGGMVLSTDLVRNSLSLFIFLNAIPYLANRKPLPYFALCLLSASLHSSGLVYFLFYFFIHRQYNKWVLLAIFLVANGIYLTHFPFVKLLVTNIAGLLMPSTKQWVDTYLSFDIPGSTFSIGYIERLITFFLLFCYINKLRQIRSCNNIFINSVFLYLVLFLILSEFRTISTRVSLIFSFGYWVIWLDLIRCISIKNNRRLYIGFILIYCTLKTISNTNNYLGEYENVLFEPKSFNERLLQFQRHVDDPS